MTLKQLLKYVLYGIAVGLLAWAVSATFRSCQTEYTEPEIEQR